MVAKKVKKKLVKKTVNKKIKFTPVKILNDHPYKIGKAYFIRTVTMYHVGKLEAVYEQELLVSGCSWIPDTGKFSEALRCGNFMEQQPFGDRNVIVGRGSIVDCCEFNHDLIFQEK